MYPPPLNCPGCDPCQNRLNLTLFGPEHVAQLIAQLFDHDNACLRAKAAKKLGCRFHADFCHNPEVLQALLDAILFDPCWVVRREAQWALYWQGAAVKDAFMVMFVAYSLDPHYMVRDAGQELITDMTLSRSECWREEFNTWGYLIRELRKVGFRAGECDSKKLWQVAFTNWQEQMKALAANGVSGKDLPDVRIPLLGNPFYNGVPAVWQPPPLPASRAHHPPRHKCEDDHAHPDGPIQTMPGSLPPGAVPVPLPAGSVPGHVVPLPAPTANQELQNPAE